jgi:hypothetical protein
MKSARTVHEVSIAFLVYICERPDIIFQLNKEISELESLVESKVKLSHISH